MRAPRRNGGFRARDLRLQLEDVGLQVGNRQRIEVGRLGPPPLPPVSSSDESTGGPPPPEPSEDESSDLLLTGGSGPKPKPSPPLGPPPKSLLRRAAVAPPPLAPAGVLPVPSATVMKSGPGSKPVPGYVGKATASPPWPAFSIGNRLAKVGRAMGGSSSSAPPKFSWRVDESSDEPAAVPARKRSRR